MSLFKFLIKKMNRKMQIWISIYIFRTFKSYIYKISMSLFKFLRVWEEILFELILHHLFGNYILKN